MTTPLVGLVPTAEGRLVRVYRTPVTLHLKCPDCRWQAQLTTRVPAGENGFPCPRGCGPVKETA